LRIKARAAYTAYRFSFGAVDVGSLCTTSDKWSFTEAFYVGIIHSLNIFVLFSLFVIGPCIGRGFSLGFWLELLRIGLNGCATLCCIALASAGCWAGAIAVPASGASSTGSILRRPAMRWAPVAAQPPNSTFQTVECLSVHLHIIIYYS
jgi:hypothetical protein